MITSQRYHTHFNHFIWYSEYAFALIGGMTVCALMALAVINVFGRNVINTPLLGYIDFIEQLMPLIAFLGVSFCQNQGGHIRMDILVNKTRGRFHWFVEGTITLLTLLLMIALTYGSWSHFMRSFDFAMPLWSRDSTLDINLPTWPIKLIIPVSFALLCVRLLFQLWGYIAAWWNNEPREIAVTNANGESVKTPNPKLKFIVPHNPVTPHESY